jgi:hypothetical protein
MLKPSPGSPRNPPQPIELNREYACPCCHQGRLRPIVLTEALGCDRCQHIFSVKDKLYIEQLAVTYPYRKLWFWDGKQWHLRRDPRDQSPPLLLCAAILFVLLLFGPLLARQIEQWTPLLSALAVLWILLGSLLLVVFIWGISRRP